MWKPGQSGNPTGYSNSSEYHRCKTLCREASAAAAEEIIRLFTHSDDDRVRFMAAQWVFEQSWGKAPPSYEPKNEDRQRELEEAVARMSPERRQQLVEAIEAHKQIVVDALAEVGVDGSVEDG